MSLIKVPSSICDKLDVLTRHFWWKPINQDGKLLALKSWDKLCYPKAKGGLGFKKAAVFNNVLLTKLAWMIASKRDSLCMSLLRAKYKVRQGWLYAKKPKIYSPIWKAIMDTKSIIVKGACYQLGDGSSINVWNDPWVLWLQNFKPKPRLDPIVETPLMESQLIDHDLHTWNTNLVNHIFYAQFAEAVLFIAIPARN